MASKLTVIVGIRCHYTGKRTRVLFSFV